MIKVLFGLETRLHFTIIFEFFYIYIQKPSNQSALMAAIVLKTPPTIRAY